MATNEDTAVTRCASCQELVALDGNVIRLWDSAPLGRDDEGQIVLRRRDAGAALLVCPHCRQRTRL